VPTSVVAALKARHEAMSAVRTEGSGT
jgi:hypothetical protein